MQKNSAKQLLYKFKVEIGVEIDDYQWKVLLLNSCQFKLIQVYMKKSEFYSYISDGNEQDVCDPHAHFFHIFKKLLNW